MIYLNVTNSFTSRAHTGIQRVTKELARRLINPANCVLLAHHNGSFFYIQESPELSAYFEGREFQPLAKFDFSDIKSGDIFFDIDGSWGDRYDATQLYSKVKQSGAILVKMHYDAVPILFPDFSHKNTVFRYIENFSAALQFADHWICISDTVRKDFEAVSKRLSLDCTSHSTIDLGSDILPEKPMHQVIGESCLAASQRRFVLAVGTVEPRKNYDLVLDVFDQLLQRDGVVTFDFVIVGRAGWNNENILKRLENHPEYKVHLHWLNAASDFELDYLYRKAEVCLCLSHYEGYGLPVVEALSRGTPTICTEKSALEEVSRGHAISVPLDTNSVINALDELTKDVISTPRVLNFRGTTWDESAQQVMEIFQSLRANNTLNIPPAQAVYISIRPGQIERSITSILRHGTFIKNFVVLTNDASYAAMCNALERLSASITLLKESDIGISNLPEDHQERNTYLRSVLYAHDAVKDNFIAIDDDCIFVADVMESDFFLNGRHKAYYFQKDGQSWLGAHPSPTSFDRGLWRTVAYLTSRGYDTRLYNSHQPQIINKQLGLRILNQTRSFHLDEWSSYFNIAKHLHPDVFIDSIYRTAGWPGNFASWLPDSIPSDILFFNDFDPNGDPENSHLAAANWRNRLEAAQRKKLEISPREVVLSASEQGLEISAHRVTCPDKINFFIPIFTTVPLEYLRYTFNAEDVRYTASDIPGFLHIPINNSESMNPFLLTIEAQIGSSDAIHRAQIEVSIEG